jgi:hypothetical protein
MPPCNRVRGLVFTEELGVGAVVVADPDAADDPAPFAKDDSASSGADSGLVSCPDSGAGLSPDVAHVETGLGTLLGAAAAD